MVVEAMAEAVVAEGEAEAPMVDTLAVVAEAEDSMAEVDTLVAIVAEFLEGIGVRTLEGIGVVTSEGIGVGTPEVFVVDMLEGIGVAILLLQFEVVTLEGIGVVTMVGAIVLLHIEDIMGFMAEDTMVPGVITHIGGFLDFQCLAGLT
jgi:hypothetical protein